MTKGHKGREKQDGIINIKTTKEVGKSTVRGLSVPADLPKHYPFFFSDTFNISTEGNVFSNCYIKFYKKEDSNVL